MNIQKHANMDSDTNILRTIHVTSTNIYLLQLQDLFKRFSRDTNPVQIGDPLPITLFNIGIVHNVLHKKIMMNLFFESTYKVFGRCSIFENSFVFENILYLQLNIGPTIECTKNYVYMFEITNTSIVYVGNIVMGNKRLIPLVVYTQRGYNIFAVKYQ